MNDSDAKPAAKPTGGKSPIAEAGSSASTGPFSDPLNLLLERIQMEPYSIVGGLMSDFMEHGKTGCGASYDHLIRNIIQERTTEQAVKQMKDHERSTLVQDVVLEAKKTHFSRVVKNHKMTVSKTTTTSAMTEIPSESECPSTAAGAPNSTMTPWASVFATPAPTQLKCTPTTPTVASGSTLPSAKPPPTTNLCNVCGKKSVSRCSRCLLVHYCSVDCQRKDWKAHKLVCKGGKTAAQKKGKKKAKPPPTQGSALYGNFEEFVRRSHQQPGESTEDHLLRCMNLSTNGRSEPLHLEQMLDLLRTNGETGMGPGVDDRLRDVMRERTERAEQSQPGEGLARLLAPIVTKPPDIGFDPFAPDPFMTREEPPDDFDADGMMAGLLREHSIHGTTGMPMFDDLVRDYLNHQRGGGT